MKSGLKFCGSAARLLGRIVLGLFLWTLWLALSLLLVLEIWIATSHELAVPAFVLRGLEERLAVSQVQVKFGHARFDPSGRILVEDLQIFLPAFSEPVVVNRSAYLEIDPWSLLAGRFEPRILHLSGGSVAIPAMLSPSGRAEEIVRDLDTTLRLQDNDLLIDHLTARVAGIAVVGRGALHLTPQPAAKVAPLPVADYLAAHYPDICRQLVRVADRLSTLDQPQLEVDFTPSDTRGAIAAVTVYAHGLKLPSPVALRATGLRLTTRFPLQGEQAVMAPVTLAMDDLQLPGGVTLQNVRARLRGSLKPALYTFEVRDILLSAGELSVSGFTFENLVARLKPGPLPQLDGELFAHCFGRPLAVRGHADLAHQTAELQVEGALDPGLLIPIGELLHRDIRSVIDFGAPIQLSAAVTIAEDWKFDRLTGHAAVADVEAHQVHIDAARGEIEFDGRNFYATHASARLGDNYAYGSFWQDFVTLDHRFLLQGRLRPLAISGWFGKWWPVFFKDYEFPVAPPDASVDIQSHLHDMRLNTVFVYTDSVAPVVHGVKFDHGRVLLFTRPNFLHGLEVFATQGAASARGSFKRQVDATQGLIGLDLDFDTTLPLEVPNQLFGPVVSDVLEPYRFAHPPTVKLLMHFDGAASPDGPHQLAQITAQSVGAFSFHDFPLSNLSFHAAIRDDEVTLDHVEVGFAGGVSHGSARVWGRDADRRLGFDYTLRNASLGEAVTTVETFSAKKKGLPPPAPDKFIQDKAGVKLDLVVSADGLYDDPFSYKGSGNASLTGDALGEVPLLGALSELLSFTSLHFTSARANFKIFGPRLEFSQVDLTGANSAIEAHGNYSLDRHGLDFTARVNPFQESTFLPTALLGAVLTPFSSVLEVKLTGQIDKPRWAFVNGPTNLLRNLAKPGKPEPSKTPVSPPDYLKR